jgi:ribosomal protein L12E/L44/L45/RPP1/RPP2
MPRPATAPAAAAPASLPPAPAEREPAEESDEGREERSVVPDRRIFKFF